MIGVLALPWRTTTDVYPEHDWPVICARVPARMVRSGGGDIIEWGYWGPDVLGWVP